MGIGDPGGEELIGGEEGLGAGALEDSRDRSGRIERLGSGQQGNLGRGAVHGDLGNDNFTLSCYMSKSLISAVQSLCQTFTVS